MRFKQAGNKKDIIAITIKSREASVSIAKGCPVIGHPNGTNDGLAVIAPESSAAAQHDFFFGFATEIVAPANMGESQVFGFCEFARVRLTTRAATSDAWASYPALALGDIMVIDSVAGNQCVSRSGAGSASNIFWAMVMGETLVSATTQASTLGGDLGGVASAATASISYKKVMVRAL